MPWLTGKLKLMTSQDERGIRRRSDRGSRESYVRESPTPLQQQGKADDRLVLLLIELRTCSVCDIRSHLFSRTVHGAYDQLRTTLCD